MFFPSPGIISKTVAFDHHLVIRAIEFSLYTVLKELYETIKCPKPERNKYLVALSNSLSDLLCLSNQFDDDDDAGLRARANKESEWEIFIDPTTPQIYLPFTSLALKRLRCK